MSMSYTHPRNILVATLQRLYDYGMTTTSGGNLSIKDDDGNIWITPGSIDKGCLRPEDIVKVSPDGKIEGLHRPSSELPFHRAVYSLRSDVKAVLHAHSPALVAFSLIGKCPDATLIPGCAKTCGKVAFAKYDIPGSEALGKLIAAEFEKGADSVIMENHGAVMGGATIAQAFARFEALDYIARIQINASTLGQTLKLEGKLPRPILETFVPERISPDECELRDSLANFRARAYRQKLLFSGNAFLSSRLGEDNFLISPANFDPMNLTSPEIVRVFNGRHEEGKIPSKAAPICREIYKHCDWVNSILMTRPPCITAFCVTGKPMDSRTIPESYIMLRDIPLISSAEYFASPDAIVSRISKTTPVVMVENCGVLTTGKTLLEAFDRLEVAEFTAKCLQLAHRMGTVKPINQQQVDEIIEAFKLPK